MLFARLISKIIIIVSNVSLPQEPRRALMTLCRARAPPSTISGANEQLTSSALSKHAVSCSRVFLMGLLFKHFCYQGTRVVGYPPLWRYIVSDGDVSYPAAEWRMVTVAAIYILNYSISSSSSATIIGSHHYRLAPFPLLLSLGNLDTRI